MSDLHKKEYLSKLHFKKNQRVGKGMLMLAAPSAKEGSKLPLAGRMTWAGKLIFQQGNYSK